MLPVVPNVWTLAPESLPPQSVESTWLTMGMGHVGAATTVAAGSMRRHWLSPDGTANGASWDATAEGRGSITAR